MKIQIQTTLILLTFTILYAEADQNLIETTCKNTPNYNLCIATIRADRSAVSTDLPGLGLILVEAVKKKSKEALVIIGKISMRSRGQPKLAAALGQCKDVYTAVVEGDVEMAEQAIRGNPKYAETGMADAAVEASTCEEAFEGVVSPSPLSRVNKAVTDLAVVARAIIRNLL